MKAITWLASVTAGVSILSASAAASAPKGWMTDLEAAFTKAKQENKAVLVEFTASDWCPPCIVMRKNVFSKKEFVDEASKKFILVELDFPEADKALADKNEPYFSKYKVEGFPSVLLFDSEGKEFNRFFANEYPTIEAFLKRLDSALERKELD